MVGHKLWQIGSCGAGISYSCLSCNTKCAKGLPTVSVTEDAFLFYYKFYTAVSTAESCERVAKYISLCCSLTIK